MRRTSTGGSRRVIVLREPAKLQLRGARGQPSHLATVFRHLPAVCEAAGVRVGYRGDIWEERRGPCYSSRTSDKPPL